MARDARATESKVTGVVKAIVDRVAGPLTDLAGMVAGVSTAITTLARLIPGLAPARPPSTE